MGAMQSAIPVTNPATGETIGEVKISSSEEVSAAVKKAKEAQKKWAALSVEERKGYLMKMASAIEAKASDLATSITKEQGKPLFPGGPGSLFEANGCCGWIQATASLDLPVETLVDDETTKAELHRVPLGVVAAVTPWNWPAIIAAWSVAPALVTGNAVVLKPSEYTTLCTLELVEIMNSVLPEGVLQVVTGDGSVGAALCSHPDVDKVVFTGSTRTGKKIAASSGANMARLTLECGGNDPGIILPGTDIPSKAGDLFWGAFINMGQTCAACKRLYVHESDVEKVVEALQGVASSMKVGNGLEEGVLLGPLSNKMQLDIVDSLVEDAKKNGASIRCGGSKPDGPGFFYPITVVTGLDNGARLVDEEQFGPVIPIIAYTSVDQAVEKANASPFGLGASVWGDDVQACQAVAKQIQAGTVWINQHATINPMIPFAATKGSGYGVEFGVEGLKAMTAPKVINMKKTPPAK